MSTSHTCSKSAGGCGCSGGTAGTAVASACNCAGAGCATCAPEGYLRPRFFAGQLLTEDDLQAMADYVLNKNRLHNRHFMGDGVVCGLAVTCNPCGGGKVVVQPGHALDCCGNDLVLECAVELDANAMVRDLRRNQLGGHDCGDPCSDIKSDGRAGAGNEKDLTRHYDLYIRYSETATEPVTPYATDDACGSSACEFTRVREGVRFEVRCAEDMASPDGFIKQALACIRGNRSLLQALTRLYDSAATGADVTTAREIFLDVLDKRAALSDCGLRATVAGVAIPPPNTPLDSARDALLTAFIALLRDCVCQAALPPCAPCDDTGVLLARIEMRECVVQDICNMERKFVLTGPNLRYWLPLDVIGDAAEEACCAEIEITRPTPTPTPTPQPNNGVVPRSLATGSSNTTTPKPSDPLDTLGDYMLAEFGLGQKDAADFAAMFDNVGKLHKAGAFDGMAPVRLGRMVKDIDLGKLLGISDGDTKPQSSVNVDAVREQIRSDNVKAMAAMESQNTALRAQLDQVMERLARLEATPEPAPDAPAGGVKKTRK